MNWQLSCVWFSSPWFGLTGHKTSSTGTAAWSGGYGFLDCIPLKHKKLLNLSCIKGCWQLCEVLRKSTGKITRQQLPTNTMWKPQLYVRAVCVFGKKKWCFNGIFTLYISIQSLVKLFRSVIDKLHPLWCRAVANSFRSL